MIAELGVSSCRGLARDLAFWSMTSPTINEPVLPEATMHACRPNEPATGVVTKNELCTAGRKSAGFVRHVEIDVSGTALEGVCRSGQAIGIIPPGEDERGRPHRLRLYSLACPTGGEDGEGKIISTTVKRTIDEHWENHKLFLGVASNYLCDVQEGEKVLLTGPNGKRFLLPEDPNQHDYLFFATGTGIAPFRGMVLELLRGGYKGNVTLVMGAPYATDLLYHNELLALRDAHPNFRYLPAISRESNVIDGTSHDTMYVQDRIRTDAEALRAQLVGEKNLIYVCGVAGMELGIFQQLAKSLTGDSLEQYLQADREALADIDNWDRRMIHKQVKPTRRVMLEVYA